MITSNYNIYNSVTAFINEISNAETSKTFMRYLGDDKYLSSQREERGDWSGTQNFAEAKNLLENGDAKSADLLKTKTAQKVAAKLRGVDSIKPTLKSDVIGGSVNVGAFLSGSPKCMRRRVCAKQQTKSKVITVVYSCAVDWTINPEEISDVNASLVAAIIALERSGYRVNLYITFSSYIDKESYSATIKIKGSDSYINIINMAYQLINPSFFRRHIFRYIETRKNLKLKKWTQNYGYYSRIKSEVIFKDNNKSLKYDKYLHFADLRNDTPDTIIRKIIN